MATVFQVSAGILHKLAISTFAVIFLCGAVLTMQIPLGSANINGILSKIEEVRGRLVNFDVFLIQESKIDCSILDSGCEILKLWL